MSTQERKVITWHFSEQPDLEAIRDALADIGGGYLYPADTECDDYAVIIAKRPMTQQQVNLTYRKSELGR